MDREIERRIDIENRTSKAFASQLHISQQSVAAVNNQQLMSFCFGFASLTNCTANGDRAINRQTDRK